MDKDDRAKLIGRGEGVIQGMVCYPNLALEPQFKNPDRIEFRLEKFGEASSLTPRSRSAYIWTDLCDRICRGVPVEADGATLVDTPSAVCWVANALTEFGCSSPIEFDFPAASPKHGGWGIQGRVATDLSYLAESKERFATAVLGGPDDGVFEKDAEHEVELEFNRAVVDGAQGVVALPNGEKISNWAF